MKNTIIFLFFVSLLVVSCKSDKEDDKEADGKKSTVKKVENEKGFQDIEILFNDKKFSSEEELTLLQEIRICSTDPALTTNSEIPQCLPDNFKLLKLHNNITLKNGFILLIKAETGGFPLRRTLVFQRERGELVKANGFVGNLIGRVPSKSGYDDLLMRFRDKDEAGFPMFYNCLFTWKDGKYEYKQVEAIEGPNWGGPVKEEFKKETSKEVYQSIINNNMLF